MGMVYALSPFSDKNLPALRLLLRGAFSFLPSRRSCPLCRIFPEMQILNLLLTLYSATMSYSIIPCAGFLCAKQRGGREC